MKNSKVILKIAFCICIALAVAFYFAGCGSKDNDNYIPLGATTGTGTGPGTGTGTGPGTGTGTSTFDGWRVLPIRSQQEYNLGMIGGEAEQHPHSIARSPSNPDIIYLSHDVGQAWKSTDAGETWRRTLCKGIFLKCGLSIEVDPVNPDIVFFGIANNWNWLQEEDEGIYRSKDGGTNWDFVLAAKTNYSGGATKMYMHRIAYDSSSATTSGATRWYAAFTDNALYRSENSGDDWSLASSLVGHTTVHEVETHPTDGQTVYLATNQGLFVSTSRGANLQSLGNLPGGEVSAIEINRQDPDMIYVTVRDDGLYRSTNGGTSFSLVRSFGAATVFINPGHPNVIYLVGLSSNTIISHDGGSTWITDMETEPFPGLGRDGSGWKSRIAGRITGIVPNPNDPNEAVAFSRATLWKTTDGGHVFKDSSTLFTGYNWSWWSEGIAFDPNDPDRFATFNCDVGMAITFNGGDYFDKRNDQAGGWFQSGLIGWIGATSGDLQPISGSQIIVAAVGAYFRTELMRSTDAGGTWELVTTDAKEHNLFIAFHPDDPDLVYAGDKISYNAGATFTSVDFGTFNGNNPSIMGMCLADADTVYAMDSGRNRILRSDDRGTTWRLYTQPGWQFKRLDPLPTFAVDPVDPDKVYTLDDPGDLAVFDGSTWRSMGVLALSGTEHANHVRHVAIDPNYPEIIYAGMFAAGMENAWRSTDGGYTWENISYNMPRTGKSPMAVNPHTGELFRGSPFGTWILPPPYASQTPIYDKCISMPSP